MKVAIIGRGESAFRTMPGHRYDIIIAINCAINVWQAHWLVSDDPSSYRFFWGRPIIGAAYRSDLLQRGEKMLEGLGSWAHFAGMWVDRAKQMPYPLTFSAESAVILAAELGATSIDCHGMIDPFGDFVNPTSVATPGRPVDEGRDRWEKERRCMRKIIAHYQNIAVTTHKEPSHG